MILIKLKSASLGATHTDHIRTKRSRETVWGGNRVPSRKTIEIKKKNHWESKTQQTS